MELTNIQFLKVKDKLCHAISYCKECPIMKLGEEKGEDSCTVLFRMYPEEVVDIVSKWADDHANYMSDFRDKFPNAMLRAGSKYSSPIPTVCRRYIYGTGIFGCMKINECTSNEGPCEQCWKEFYV